MRKFTLLSALGALLFIGTLNAHAGVVSCTWVQVASYGLPTGVGGRVEQCYTKPATMEGFVANRQVEGGTYCKSFTVSPLYTSSGGCLNPTFYTAAAASSASSAASQAASSAPASAAATKVVNYVTIPYSATVLEQGTCYSQGCGTAYSKCTTTLGGVFATNSPYYVCFK